jgi:Kef-type K+ transport system membrane component KefB/nucleotide-binding universal stress UspA family protein
VRQPLAAGNLTGATANIEDALKLGRPLLSESIGTELANEMRTMISPKVIAKMRMGEGLRIGVCGVGLALSWLSCAFAADASPTGPSEVIFLFQIVLLIFFGRLLGEIMQRIGQPAVMGQLLAGLLLGPSALGALWPGTQHILFPSSHEQKSMLDAISQLGVLMLLLLTGMETDLKLVGKVGRAAITVSISGICVPFMCGFALGEYLPESILPDPAHRLIGSLFLGTALSISSVKIVAMVVREMNFMRRNLGQVIVASAVIDDTIGWIVIAIIFSLATHGSVDAASLAKSISGTLLFLAISLTIGRRLVFTLIRWTNDNLVSEAPVISMILLLMAGMALTTQLIGVHTVLGAFVAGILIGESPILTKHIDQQLRGLIMGLFMPVFFGLAGLSADLTILKDSSILALTCGLIAIASAGKFAGAFLGGMVGRLTPRESLALACGMNARGSTEVIIATIGLSMGVLSQNLYTMIVVMAVVTTMVMPPMLRWALLRLPMGKDEKARLEREEFEAKGFLANLDRFLLAVDESANGKFASRLAGLLAGARGVPTTVLHIGPDAENQEETRSRDESAESAVKAGAKITAAVEQESRSVAPMNVEVTTRAKETGSVAAVTAEARKGYGLLVVGVENMVGSDGSFDYEPAHVAAAFEGPLAVVVSRGEHLEQPAESSFRILVPITGTEVSRRAAEVAVALARANGVPITALYVASRQAHPNARRRNRRTSPSHRYEEAILKDVVALGERYDTEVRTSLQVDVAPEEAILRKARRYNLIVMGVNRRPGDTLFFGNVAAAILKQSKAAILFVSN